MNYELTVINLLEDIDADESYVKQKDDTVLVMLRKKNKGRLYTCISFEFRVSLVLCF